MKPCGSMSRTWRSFVRCKLQRPQAAPFLWPCSLQPTWPLPWADTAYNVCDFFRSIPHPCHLRLLGVSSALLASLSGSHALLSGLPGLLLKYSSACYSWIKRARSTNALTWILLCLETSSNSLCSPLHLNCLPVFQVIAKLQVNMLPKWNTLRL